MHARLCGQTKALPVLLSMRKVWAPVDIQLKLECFPKLRTYAVVPRSFRSSTQIWKNKDLT